MKKLLIALAACGLIACNNDNGRYELHEPFVVLDTKTGIVYVPNIDPKVNRITSVTAYDYVNGIEDRKGFK